MREAMQRHLSPARGRELREEVDRLRAQLERARPEADLAIELYQDMLEVMRGSNAQAAIAAAQERPRVFEARERALGKLRKLQGELAEAEMRHGNWVVLARELERC